MINIKNKKKIHFIGIGGIGMSAIAEIMKYRGLCISGSDMNRSDMVTTLENKGIEIFIGHRAENINDVDLVVYTAAVGEDNPELCEARNRGIDTICRAQMLGLLMEEFENSIAISGTHGKTTTTSMISIMLKNANVDPTLLVGGNLEELQGNVRIGESEYFVTEACEYMDSFLYLKPQIEIILNIDSDHLDYFKDIEHISDSFREFALKVPQNTGKIIAYTANPFVTRAVAGLENVVSFGLNEDCDYYAKNLSFDGEGISKYTLFRRGENLGIVDMNIPGEYNVLNSLAAIACIDTLGIDIEVAKKTLREYKGTQRRFDVLGYTKKGNKVVDDYAHHPTEIKAALQAVRNFATNRIWCVFQPHTYTRTIALFNEFSESFSNADIIILPEIYAAREKNIHKISSKALADKIKENYPEKEVRFIAEFDDIIELLKKEPSKDDILITMGAGDVYKIGEALIRD